MTDHGRRLLTLDMVRGVAALLVAAYHWQQFGTGRTIAGYLAVDVFFVLSGVVLALSYGPRLADGLSSQRFLALRLIRLYPLYLAGCVVGIAAWIAQATLIPQVTHAATAVTSGLLMLPAPFESGLFPFNGALWSLFFEMVVSIAFALTLWRASGRMLATIALSAAIYLVATVGAPDYLNIGWSWPLWLGGLSRALFAFCAGLLIVRHVDLSASRASWLALVPVGVLVAAIVAAPPQEWRAAFELGAVLLLFPVLVGAALRWDIPAPLGRTAVVLGDLSYPLYALHWPLITLLKPVLAPLGRVAGAMAFVAMLSVAALAAARFYDAPVRRWLTARLRQSTPAPAAALAH